MLHNANKTCVISCIFGEKFKYVYPAPKDFDSYFFCNNLNMRSEVEKQGWTFIYMNQIIHLDIAKSSFQSKYIKFLQFLKDKNYEFFLDYSKIFYVDHKFQLEKSHVDDLLSKMNRGIVLRTTPKLKLQIWDEVAAAMGQERYSRFMPATLEFINKQIEMGLSENTRICNTGLMVFDISNDESILFTDEIYQALLAIGTSECQIIWGMISQRYDNFIQKVDWDSLPIVWKTPEENPVYMKSRMSKNSSTPKSNA
jgi:hypothetical protein